MFLDRISRYNDKYKYCYTLTYGQLTASQRETFEN